jgi:hypothetical protein
VKDVLLRWLFSDKKSDKAIREGYQVNKGKTSLCSNRFRNGKTEISKTLLTKRKVRGRRG